MKKFLSNNGIALVFLAGLLVLAVSLASGKITTAMAKQTAAWTGLVLLLLGCIYMIYDKSALRDESDQKDDPPFSFTRVQLWWWTAIIFGCLFGIYAINGEFLPLNETCLVLLGISAATTVSGRMIDNSDSMDPKIVRNQDHSKSEGFLRDILSDANGISMHRFQTVLFNGAYGVYFVIKVFSDVHAKDFPTFSTMVLAMLGVSQAAFLTMKMNENQTYTPPADAATTTTTTTGAVGQTTTTAPPATNDELVDADQVSPTPADN